MPEAFDAALALRAPAPLADFNAAGVLDAADVHVAVRLGRLAGGVGDAALLGAAFAVRAVRLGHVCVDLATVRGTVVVEAEEGVDLDALPWPAADGWLAAVQNSGLVGEEAPLAVERGLLYLDRYWREERFVAAALLGRAEAPPPTVDGAVLEDGLARLLSPGRQREAARTAVCRRLAVIAGGPGTGKTTTVSRVCALLVEQALARGERLPHIALAAPTGKAAARLTEAVRSEAAGLQASDRVRDAVRGLEASTLHRLLGWKPGAQMRFRHDRANRLPHDVVVVDETSMVSLTLMARLLEAVRADARVVLVGDPGQLASVEAGAVLGDVVGLPDGVVTLERVHRFDEQGAIAEVAGAVRRGDADALLEVLARDTGEVVWLPVDLEDDGAAEALDVVRDGVVDTARAVVGAAAAGDARGALDALPRFRVLCAHRRGPAGVRRWTLEVERWLTAAGIDRGGPEREWYAGRPLLVTENDRTLRLFNGDAGVVVDAGAGALRAAFDRADGPLLVSPSRIEAVETVYAMTIHKSQGSQFATAAVLLPGPSSRLLTRELLYTAVTRAQHRLVVVGTEEALRTAVARPLARASGLRGRLSGTPRRV